MSHIFISYSRKDINFALKIVDPLATNNLDIGIDWKSNLNGDVLLSERSTMALEE